MVATQLTLAAKAPDLALAALTEGLSVEQAEAVREAHEFARREFAELRLSTGEPVFDHAMAVALIAAELRLDPASRISGLLYAVPVRAPEHFEWVTSRFDADVPRLLRGLQRLEGLRVPIGMDDTAQTETLRKMLLALVEDIRVVLLRLASRLQTLRWFASEGGETAARVDYARESLALYAPLANRLGVGQIKWEIEDLSFRFLEPETYKRIARLLDERRLEREAFVARVVQRLSAEVAALGIAGAEVYGRAKHIYSIWNKMRKKGLDFSQVYDVRAVRVLVPAVADCYAVLSRVHELWPPIAGEFDDYIARPKPNGYRSLHTAVRAEDGRPLEVQVRTFEMHRHAEFGVAAHWRYKEGADKTSPYDQKIALLRSLLAWRDEVVDSSEWADRVRHAVHDDTIFVLTPTGRVVDLPQGATPVDFAYRIHTDVGHRCRGARVDGQLVPLDTPLRSGQTVEVVTAKEGGPSRDWLNPALGYVKTKTARAKIRAWFAQQQEAELLARGRSLVERELQREGHTRTNLEKLAERLGFKSPEALYRATARGEIGPRAIVQALQPAAAEAPVGPVTVPLHAPSARAGGAILVGGQSGLLTKLARCCHPMPPDEIVGFVTRGRGVTIHRADCRDLLELSLRHPERLVTAQWNEAAAGTGPRRAYPVEIQIEAHDRQGLLRDVSEVFTVQRLNVTAVQTLTTQHRARMNFTVEAPDAERLAAAIAALRAVPDVVEVRRR